MPEIPALQLRLSPQAKPAVLYRKLKSAFFKVGHQTYIKFPYVKAGYVFPIQVYYVAVGNPS